MTSPVCGKVIPSPKVLKGKNLEHPVPRSLCPRFVLSIQQPPAMSLKLIILKRQLLICTGHMSGAQLPPGLMLPRGNLSVGLGIRACLLEHWSPAVSCILTFGVSQSRVLVRFFTCLEYKNLLNFHPGCDKIVVI